MKNVLVFFILFIVVNVFSFAQQNNPPPVPQNFQAEISGTNDVILTWRSAGSDINYIVHYSRQNNPSSAEVIDKITDTSYKKSGLSNGTHYFWVSSLSLRNGLRSDMSRMLEVSIPPTTSQPLQPPRNVRTETPTTSTVTIRWDDAGSGIRYRVYWSYQNDPNRAEPLSDPVNGNWMNVSSMTSGTNYYFWVTSLRDGRESEKSLAVSVRTLATAFLPPVITITTQPAATAVPGGSLTVAASVTPSTLLSYQWYRNTTNSNIGGTAINGATGRSYTIPTNLTTGTYYYYCVVSATGASSIRTNISTATVRDFSRLNTLGASVGTSFSTPLFIGTVYGTFSLAPNWFAGIGLDLGLGAVGIDSAESYSYDGYYSLCPFAQVGGFIPFWGKGGWYLSGGIGYFYSKHTFTDGKAEFNTFVFDVSTGFLIADWFNISYTLRTNFKGVTNKISAGVVYRFK